MAFKTMDWDKLRAETARYQSLTPEQRLAEDEAKHFVDEAPKIVKDQEDRLAKSKTRMVVEIVEHPRSMHDWDDGLKTRIYYKEPGREGVKGATHVASRAERGDTPERQRLDAMLGLMEPGTTATLVGAWSPTYKDGVKVGFDFKAQRIAAGDVPMDKIMADIPGGLVDRSRKHVAETEAAKSGLAAQAGGIAKDEAASRPPRTKGPEEPSLDDVAHAAFQSTREGR
jgi:hypothetical protein